MKVKPTFSEIDQDLSRLTWATSDTKPTRLYAKRGIPNPNPPPRQISQYAHRVVLERKLGRKLLNGECCDHINHQPLDNRRENLRVTDAVGNGQNRSPTPFRGAVRHRDKWKAQLKLRGVVIYLGLFESRHEAASFAAKRRKELGFIMEEEAASE